VNNQSLLAIKVLLTASFLLSMAIGYSYENFMFFVFIFVFVVVGKKSKVDDLYSA